MHFLHEALARERMREGEQRCRAASLTRDLRTQRRGHRLARHALAAERRRARKADQTLAR